MPGDHACGGRGPLEWMVAAWGMLEADLHLSVIIPMYNESARVIPTLEDAVLWLHEAPWTSEIVLVDDGSKDATVERVTPKLFERPIGALQRVRLVRHERNRGKGAAVRTGLAAAEGDWRLMMDADNSTRVSEVVRLLAEAERSGAGLVCGSRNVADSDVVTRPSRKLMGSAFRMALKGLGMGMLRDTQCGFKLYRADVAAAIAEIAKEDRFAFDLEHLLIADRLGVGVREVGISWTHRDGGTIRPVRDGLRMLRDAARIRMRYARGLPPVMVEVKPMRRVEKTPAERVG